MAWIRLPARLPARPARTSEGLHGIILLIPAHDEAGRIGALIERLPGVVHGMATTCLVVDDGSSDGTAAEALAAGAQVISHPVNRGLGAAIRTGLVAAVAERCAAVAFCDGDGEYAPEELGALVAPIVDGSADYVVGSRFLGDIRRMRVLRRLGNVVLTRWVRFMVRQPVTDGQSGYRALSWDAARECELIHDYNYAQIMTLDLVGRGFVYREVPIGYEFRTSGRSFVRLLPYLRRVVPASVRTIRHQSSTV